jgi:hypothetical protein
LLDQYIEAFHKVTDNAVELLKKIWTQNFPEN